jgi:hypothetical protein
VGRGERGKGTFWEEGRIYVNDWKEKRMITLEEGGVEWVEMAVKW